MGLSTATNSFIDLCKSRIQSKLLDCSRKLHAFDHPNILPISPQMYSFKCYHTHYNGDIYFLLWDTQLKYIFGLKERVVQGVEVGGGFRSATVRNKRERPSFPCALLPCVSEAQGRCGARDAPRVGKSAEALEKRRDAPRIRDAPRVGKSVETLEVRPLSLSTFFLGNRVFPSHLVGVWNLRVELSTRGRKKGGDREALVEFQ